MLGSKQEMLKELGYRQFLAVAQFYDLGNILSRFCGLLLLCSIGVAAFAQKGYKRAYTLFNAEAKRIWNLSTNIRQSIICRL